VSRKFDIRTVKLSQAIVDSHFLLLGTQKFHNHLGFAYLQEIYDTLRYSVYGIPAKAIPAEELIHCLAEMLGKSDPSEPDKPIGDPRGTAGGRVGKL
jgi:hypothetical protein